ncbi:uncharacterized protein LOC121727882 [Aricia agestis]|uniref:uncharacterized protein LOC121727882 n=1 Tax=Aricia agestis TaxID=91739 RepID=UPI001C2072EB|nr:uncharacterized protein LOC121727882 [Aricia agestis]XP_041971862.1 uncharacterized protein LOC121727882 [Aricia agestis]
MATGAELEVEKIKQLEARIRAPCVWGRVPCGVRFEDLQDTRYDAAIQFLRKHYLNEEITYKSVKILDDEEGTEEFLSNAKIWLKDKMSIAAVKEGTDKLVGLLIMRIQEKNAFSRTFSKVKFTYNERYTTVMKFYRDVEQDTNLFEELGVRRYFKIYVLALKPRYRHRGIAKEMLRCTKGLCESAQVPALAGIFTTARSRQIADEIGFQKIKELYYTRYLVNEKRVFWDTGLGNYGAALMAYRIPDIEEPVEVETQASSRFSINTNEEAPEEN